MGRIVACPRGALSPPRASWFRIGRLEEALAECRRTLGLENASAPLREPGFDLRHAGLRLGHRAGFVYCTLPVSMTFIKARYDKQANRVKDEPEG